MKYAILVGESTEISAVGVFPGAAQVVTGVHIGQAYTIVAGEESSSLYIKDGIVYGETKEGVHYALGKTGD
jgi:hypothetical protein